MRILLVEFDALHREMLRRLLSNGLPRYEIRAAAGPGDARKLLGDSIRLLISRVYFPGHLGNRDFEAAAALFRDARKAVGERLPIIAMTTSPVDDEASRQVLVDNAFPTDDRVVLFDLVATRPRQLVEKAAELLGIQTHLFDIVRSLM